MKCLTVVIAATLWILFQSSVYAQWTVETRENEMDGTVTFAAQSETVAPTKPLSSPYDGTASKVNAMCVEDELILLITFSKSILPSRDMYIDARLKFDNEEPIEVSAINVPNIKGLVIRYTKYPGIIDKFSTAQTVLLEVPTNGLGRVYFRYPLGGSAEAISTLPCID